MSIQSCVYIMTGIPGSGKSTYAKTLNIPILSTDELRKELVGNAEDIHTISRDEIYTRLLQRAKEYVAQGMSFVFDATNVDPVQRSVVLQQLKKDGQKLIGVVLAVPLETALDRNAGRDRNVPVDRIEEMYKQIVANPLDTESELYDEVQMIDEQGKAYVVYRRDGGTKEVRTIISPEWYPIGHKQ